MNNRRSHNHIVRNQVFFLFFILFLFPTFVFAPYHGNAGNVPTNKNKPVMLSAHTPIVRLILGVTYAIDTYQWAVFQEHDLGQCFDAVSNAFSIASYDTLWVKRYTGYAWFDLGADIQEWLYRTFPNCDFFYPYG